MNRRDFLQLSGLALASVFLQTSSLGKMARVPVEVESQGKTYRGTVDGDIYVSEDLGRTWNLHTRFGPQYSITRLSKDANGQIVTMIEYLGYRFQLTLSKTNKYWRTTV